MSNLSCMSNIGQLLDGLLVIHSREALALILMGSSILNWEGSIAMGHLKTQLAQVNTS